MRASVRASMRPFVTLHFKKMYMEEWNLGGQRENLGDQMEDLSDQREDLGDQREDLGDSL